MSLDPMDYWRLADELSVIDASILITGNNPELKHRIDIGDDIAWVQARNYDGFDAVFKALRNDILSNGIKANVVLFARDGDYQDRVTVFENEHLERIVNLTKNSEISFEYREFMRISRPDMRKMLSDRTLSSLYENAILMLYSEPDWERTTIEVSDLKAWLMQRGVHAKFFFPQAVAEGFRDISHPRYSPKLACAVAAWESVERKKSNQSVKSTLQEWISANASRFEMVGDDGVPSKKAVEEVAAVANWQTKGGANATPNPSYDDQTHRPPQNFAYEHVPRLPSEEDDLPF